MKYYKLNHSQSIPMQSFASLCILPTYLSPHFLPIQFHAYGIAIANPRKKKKQKHPSLRKPKSYSEFRDNQYKTRQHHHNTKHQQRKHTLTTTHHNTPHHTTQQSKQIQIAKKKLKRCIIPYKY